MYNNDWKYGECFDMIERNWEALPGSSSLRSCLLIDTIDVKVHKYASFVHRIRTLSKVDGLKLVNQRKPFVAGSTRSNALSKPALQMSMTID
jgi:hypothetical protein